MVLRHDANSWIEHRFREIGGRTIIDNLLAPRVEHHLHRSPAEERIERLGRFLDPETVGNQVGGGQAAPHQRLEFPVIPRLFEYQVPISSSSFFVKCSMVLILGPWSVTPMNAILPPRRSASRHRVWASGFAEQSRATSDSFGSRGLLQADERVLFFSRIDAYVRTATVGRSPAGTR